MEMGFFFLAIVIVVILILVGSWFEAERRRILGSWATSRGWIFLGTATDDMPDMQQRFDVLEQGRHRYAYNIAKGKWQDREAQAFDWHWVTGSGKQTTTHHMSAVLVRSCLPLKPLLIRPEGFMDTLADLVGFRDIDFESAEFSRRFFVKAEDRRWAYDVIQPATMEYLLAAPAFSLGMSGDWVLIWNGSQWDAAGRETALEHACAVLERMPAFLNRQQADRS